VKLSDERDVPGQGRRRRDPATDIAVVKIESEGPHVPLALGDSDAIDVGDWVVAIGNPFGLSHTVSAGIISAKGRTKRRRAARSVRLLQLPADRRLHQPRQLGRPAPQPERGEVVGINTAIRGGARRASASPSPSTW
jgi:serine protease Do